MTLTIIGTGPLARAIGCRMIDANIKVAFVDDDFFRSCSLAAELGRRTRKMSTVEPRTFAQAILGEIIVLTGPYECVPYILETYGDRLAGKIVVDTTNPLNATNDDFVTPPGSSGAEEIAKLLPDDVHLVKAFNTIFAQTLSMKCVAGQAIDVFIAGDDAVAKEKVADLVETAGLLPVDVGDLKRSRQIEAVALLHISLQSTLETDFMSAVKIIS